MSVKVRIPSPLRSYTNGADVVEVPAGSVRDAERTIPRSTVIGISIAATLYVLGTVVVMGVLPREQLAQSMAPFSDAAQVMWGPWGAIAISVAVVLSSIGALNVYALSTDLDDHAVRLLTLLAQQAA